MQSRLEKQAFQADVIERKNKEAIEFLKELITVAIPPRKAGISSLYTEDMLLILMIHFLKAG